MTDKPRTPAQAAQQDNRDNLGRYRNKQHDAADVCVDLEQWSEPDTTPATSVCDLLAAHPANPELKVTHGHRVHDNTTHTTLWFRGHPVADLDDPSQLADCWMTDPDTIRHANLETRVTTDGRVRTRRHNPDGSTTTRTHHDIGLHTSPDQATTTISGMLGAQLHHHDDGTTSLVDTTSGQHVCRWQVGADELFDAIDQATTGTITTRLPDGDRQHITTGTGDGLGVVVTRHRDGTHTITSGTHTIVERGRGTLDQARTGHQWAWTLTDPDTGRTRHLEHWSGASR